MCYNMLILLRIFGTLNTRTYILIQLKAFVFLIQHRNSISYLTMRFGLWNIGSLVNIVQCSNIVKGAYYDPLHYNDSSFSYFLFLIYI